MNHQIHTDDGTPGRVAASLKDALRKAAEARLRETRDDIEAREIELAFGRALCRMPPG